MKWTAPSSPSDVERHDLGEERPLRLEHAQTPALRAVHALAVVPAHRGDRGRQLVQQEGRLDLGQLEQPVEVAARATEIELRLQPTRHGECSRELESEQPLLELMPRALGDLERGIGPQRSNRDRGPRGRNAAAFGRTARGCGAGPLADRPHDVREVPGAEALGDLPDRRLAHRLQDVAVVARFDRLDRLAQLEVSGGAGAEAPRRVVDVQRAPSVCGTPRPRDAPRAIREPAAAVEHLGQPLVRCGAQHAGERRWLAPAAPAGGAGTRGSARAPPASRDRPAPRR